VKWQDFRELAFWIGQVKRSAAKLERLAQPCYNSDARFKFGGEHIP
jgi:hypothetical protein